LLGLFIEENGLELPISIDRVVTSARTLVGDLVITRSVFYFFPTDTVSTGVGFHDKHTSRTTAIALAEHVPAVCSIAGVTNVFIHKMPLSGIAAKEAQSAQVSLPEVHGKVSEHYYRR
jgi:hypothetical protein